MYEEAVGDSSRRRIDGWKVATVVLAVAVVALLGVLIVSQNSDDGATTASADDSAELGCRLLTEIPEGGYTEDDSTMEDAFRLSAIGMLAHLAGEQDGAYDDLEETMGKMADAGARLSLTTEEFPGQLDDARDTCATTVSDLRRDTGNATWRCGRFSLSAHWSRQFGADR